MQAQLVVDRLCVRLQIEGTHPPIVFDDRLKAHQVLLLEAIAGGLWMSRNIRSKPGGRPESRIGGEQRTLTVVQRAHDDVRLRLERAQDVACILRILESERSGAVVSDDLTEGREILDG